MRHIYLLFILLCSHDVLWSQHNTIPLYSNDKYSWYEERITQGDFSATAKSPDHIVSDFVSIYGKESEARNEWRRRNDLAPYPSLETPFAIEKTIYNMGLDEMVNAVEPDFTLRTGAKWVGVWTRDISYSIMLSMAYLLPNVSKNSLLRKVTPLGRIVEDTGTGGSWPCSSDRVVWALAAWEIYKATGDKDWIQTIYRVVKNSVEDDFLTVYDPQTGLVRGESSFIDWRIQSYPAWMQPADIYQSQCLGTCAVHCQTLNVLSSMADILGYGDDSSRYRDKAEQLKTAINKHLWLPQQGYYAQYLYGRNFNVASPRSETLGEALTILYDIASPQQQRTIACNMPVEGFGPTIFWPHIPGVPPYHNNAVWPWVTGYWMLAAAKAGNEAAVMNAVGSIYRAAALFCTNKENFEADNGDWGGPRINSSNMLWCVAANTAVVHRLYFGINFLQDALEFKPFIPQELSAKRVLSNFSYRNAVLEISVEGYGNRIKEFRIDGKKMKNAIFSGTIAGRHRVDIVMDNNIAPSSINRVNNRYSLATPAVVLSDNILGWSGVEGAQSYDIVRNGALYGNLKNLSMPLTEQGEYQVIAVAADKVLNSFAGEPITYRTSGLYTYAIDSLYISRGENREVTISVEVKDEDYYSVDWLYANGNGSITDRNKCAIRTLYVDGNISGVSVFPQRGLDEWDNKGWSSKERVWLSKGHHDISLKFNPWNENMNIEVNEAIIHQLRLTALYFRYATLTCRPFPTGLPST